RALGPARAEPDRQPRRALLNPDQHQVVKEHFVAAPRPVGGDPLPARHRRVAAPLEPEGEAEMAGAVDPADPAGADLRVAVKAHRPPDLPRAESRVAFDRPAVLIA